MSRRVCLPAPPIALTSAIRIHDVSRYLAALRGEMAKGDDTARACTGALEREVSRLMKLASTLPSAPIGKAPAEAIQVREPCKPDADSPPGPSGSVIVAFDFETTGLYPDESDIIEIGGVKFTPTGEVAGRFERFANPGYAIPPESTAVSGITTEMVAGAEPPLTVLEPSSNGRDPMRSTWRTTPRLMQGFSRPPTQKRGGNAPRSRWRIRSSGRGLSA